VSVLVGLTSKKALELNRFPFQFAHYGTGKVLLYSGGMDSWIISKLWEPDIKLYIDIRGSYSQEEIARLPEDVVIESLDLSRFERADKIVPLRNLFFVAIASLYGTEICLGATAGDRVLDKSHIFADISTELLDFLWRPQHWTRERNIKVVLPFKDLTKTGLVRLYVNKGFDLDEAYFNSFSCYTPVNNKPCWSCKACVRKYIAFRENGYLFPIEDEQKSLEFIKQNPDMFAGRGEEETQIKRILEGLK
jgi:7-cyano-7-deazaguanine synthase